MIQGDAAMAQAAGPGAPGGLPPGAAAWQPVAPDARRKRGFMVADLILIVDLAILALLLLGTLLLGPAEAAEEVSLELVWFGIILNFVLLGVLPVTWLLLTRSQPVEGTLRWLRLKTDHPRGPAFWLGIGCLLAVALYGLLIVLALLMTLLEVEPGGDPTFAELARAGGWPLVIGVSLAAGVGEEVLFRGMLQRWVGVYGQAVAFALMHLNQGWIAVAFIFVLAVLLGLALRKGAPLWALMVAHTGYDLIVFGQLRIAVG